MSKWSPTGLRPVLSSMFWVLWTIFLNFWLLIFHSPLIQFAIRFESPRIWILFWFSQALSQVLCFSFRRGLPFFSSTSLISVLLRNSSAFHKAFPIFWDFPPSLSTTPIHPSWCEPLQLSSFSSFHDSLGPESLHKSTSAPSTLDLHASGCSPSFCPSRCSSSC